MILPIHERVRDRLSRTLQEVYGLPPGEVPQLLIEYPPKRELGDLATPVAFELARRLRKAPRAIAQEVAAALGAMDGISRVEAAPNGYLNIYLDRVAFTRGVIATAGSRLAVSAAAAQTGKTIVEHTDRKSVV